MRSNASAPNSGAQRRSNTRAALVLLTIIIVLLGAEVVGLLPRPNPISTMLETAGAGTALLIDLLGSLFGDMAGLDLVLRILAAASVVILLLLFLIRRLRQDRLTVEPRRDAPQQGQALWLPPAGPGRDVLTGLPDRTRFLVNLEAALASHREKGRQLALHVLDVDNFRAVNQQLGEAEGDNLLKAIARRLLFLVEKPELLGRLGDDEFGIIQPDASGERHAEIYAARIQGSLKDGWPEPQCGSRLGATIGAALYPAAGADAHTLLRHGCLALAEAKKRRSAAVRFFSPEMERRSAPRSGLELDIRTALREGWFALHFQPQYDLGSRRLTGFEALLRMNHPDHGVVGPSDILPVAEAAGLMEPLNEWVLAEALGTAAHWPHHLTLAVNMSAMQVARTNVAQSVAAALAAASFEARRLHVELPEAVFLDPAEAVLEQLRALKALGVTVVIDDFATGQSSLAVLSRSLCDAVKVDRSFVQRLGREASAEKLARSVIALGRALQLRVIAEGVESAEQAHFLMTNNCRDVQGFLFGKPVPASELAAVIARDIRSGAAAAWTDDAPGAGALSR